jgi:hypothetical protein
MTTGDPCGLQIWGHSAIKNVLSENNMWFAFQSLFLLSSHLCEAFMRLLVRVLDKLYRAYVVSFSSLEENSQNHNSLR